MRTPDQIKAMAKLFRLSDIQQQVLMAVRDKIKDHLELTHFAADAKKLDPAQCRALLFVQPADASLIPVQQWQKGRDDRSDILYQQ